VGGGIGNLAVKGGKKRKQNNKKRKRTERVN